jgi:hypothetical protein
LARVPALYSACLRLFAIVGEGTPGPWDAPRHFVAMGPYRWVRNPIYVSALLVVLGEAWLFLSLPLLEYAVAMAIACHLFVIGYEEPTLRRSFGESYAEYRRAFPRWIPRPPVRLTLMPVPRVRPSGAKMRHQLKIDDPVALRYQSGPEPDGLTCARAPSP